jgi:hypothetical protein
VASAISSAQTAGSGNTVTIPSCAGTVWTTALSFTQTGSLNIIGAGSLSTTGGGDVTNIIDNVNHNVSGNPDYMLLIQSTATSQCLRVAGITFKSNGSSVTSNNGVIQNFGTSTCTRWDHNHFSQLNQLQFEVGGDIEGVADHNIFDPSDLGVRTLGDGNGDAQWNTATNFGTTHFFFFENNTFNQQSTTVPTPANDCLSGGKGVYRFNTFNNGAALQTHPTGHAGDDRGCRAQEVYDNNFTGSNPTNCPGGSGNSCEFNAMFMSSGAMMMWGNAVPSLYQNFISLHELRSSTITYTQTAPPGGWGYCGNTQSGVTSAWDQNTSASTGYACIDQPGRGVGDLLSGNFPNKCNITLNPSCTTFTGQWPRQALEPIYEFADIWNPTSGFPGSFINNADPTRIVNNQDYYTYTQTWNGSAFTGTAFDGTVGTGSGTLASRPSTCTTGVGYWATDQGTWNTTNTAGPVTAQIGNQGVLYTCISTNTWSTAPYTPYTYPHPLTTSSTQASPSTCSPGTGTYVASQTPACTNPNSGTTVQCYTTNGTTPATNGLGTGCTTGTSLSSGGTVSISSTTTLSIIAGTSTSIDSSVNIYFYTISAVATSRSNRAQ